MKFTTIANAKKLTGLSYLGNRNISAKLIKNEKVSNVVTYCMYLAPSNSSGYNVCEGSTKECRLGCLSTSGHAAMDITSGKNIIKNCRINKTKLFIEEPNFFMNWLIADLTYHKKKAEKEGLPFSVRLNGTSDIDWTLQFNSDHKNLFEIFNDVMFYDYTKVYNRFENKPLNYHLTFSYTGKNTDQCIELLKQGYNVTVIFDVKKRRELPKEFLGCEVIDGDVTDFRPTDGNGVIVGLRWKRIANKAIEAEIKNSCFVVKH